ncbi:MAG: signal recognition particle protein [Candidatus Korarchaeota archaeon]|nr:signal recognition particle protein [Candidatus Korarchaeota archaeon]
MLDSFRSSLQKLFNKIRGLPYIDEKLLNDILMEFQRTLIDADVSVMLASEITNRIREKILKTKIPEGIPLNNIVLQALYEELVSLMGKKSHRLNVRPGKQNIIMLVGLQGSGKTTTAAKLANYLKKRGYKVILVCADTYRPGAYDQLKQLSEDIGVPFFGDKNEKNPVKIVKKALKQFKKADVLIVDTAGRHKEEKGLIDEMKKLAKVLHPDETILVIDGLIGQRAYDQAKAFSEAAPVGAIIVTKLDGSARGGGALAASAATGAPIKFIGTGEKISDLEPYVPEYFVARLLGMPDPNLLKEIVESTPKAILSGKFTLRDLLAYYESVGGGQGFLSRIKDTLKLKGITDKMIETSMKRQLAILKSMTAQELDDPSLFKDRKRIERVAFGSGANPIEVKRLLVQFEKIRKLVRTLMRSRKLSKEAALRKIMEGKVDLTEIKGLRRIR